MLSTFATSFLITLIAILVLLVLLVPGIILSNRRKLSNSGGNVTTSVVATSAPAPPAAKAAEPEKKKEAKKVEFAFSWWLLLYSFLIAGFIIPSLTADSLSTRDTWLLVTLISVAAAFLVATIVKYYFNYDDAIGKVNKVAAGLLILGFVFLLFQNNFSTTAALKDAGARTSGFTTGVVEFLAGSRKGTSWASGNGTETPSGDLPKLGTDDYLDNVPGRFPAMTIAAGSRLGPVNDYDDSCLKHAQGGGTGTLVIMTRPDFTSEPVVATSDANGVTVPGHEGPAYQYFYVAKGGNVLLNLQRREGDSSCR